MSLANCVFGLKMEMRSFAETDNNAGLGYFRPQANSVNLVTEKGFTEKGFEI